MAKKILIGQIVKISGDLTAKVEISRKKNHPKYHKQFVVSKLYLVHNPENKYIVGQTVAIEESKPISKNKRFSIKKEVKENKWFNFDRE